MWISKPSRSFLAAGILVLLSVHPASASQLGTTAVSGVVTDEVERLRTLISSTVPPDPRVSSLLQEAQEGLTQARKALDKKREHIALYELEAARQILLSAIYMVEHWELVEKGELGPFLELWEAAGGPLVGRESGLERGTLEAMPPLFRALAESSMNEALLHYRASRLYAANASVSSGLYYLGLAHAQLNLLNSGSGTGPNRLGATPSLPSLSGELDSLEDRVLSAYKPPASMDHHSAFILVNSSVKRARELIERGWAYGALLQLLMAEFRFAAIGDPAEAAFSTSQWRRLDSTFEERIREAGGDQGLARLYLEMGRTMVEEGESSGELSKETARKVASIYEVVLPKYFELMVPTTR